MTDQLTQEDIATLTATFPADQHEWNYAGFVYVKEDAITGRIEQVDPTWQFEILHCIVRDQQVTITARMTINDVSRDGVGMANIEVKKETGYPANEPEKSAATDALKRCARLFGVGRYLTEAKGVTEKNITKWLTEWNSHNRSEPQSSPLKTPRTKRVQTEQAAPEQAPDGEGEVRSVLAIEVLIAYTGNGKPYYIFRDANENGYTAWTRTPFANAGYISKEEWEGDNGTIIPLKPYIPFLARCERSPKDGCLYWNVVIDSIPKLTPEAAFGDTGVTPGDAISWIGSEDDPGKELVF
jgi:hypothetical protein